MKPCPECHAAIPNQAQTCPDCGAATPLPVWRPPPEAGPGVSGGPEERELVRSAAIATMICGTAAAGIGYQLWSTQGLLLSLPVGGLAFLLRLLKG